MRRRKNHPALSTIGDTSVFFIKFSSLNATFNNIIPLPPQTRIVAASFSQQDFWTCAAVPICWLRVAQLLIIPFNYGLGIYVPENSGSTG